MCCVCVPSSVLNGTGVSCDTECCVCVVLCMCSQFSINLAGTGVTCDTECCVCVPSSVLTWQGLGSVVTLSVVYVFPGPVQH